MPTYYPINEETARTAHHMVHMSDYTPNSCTASYKAAVDEAAALVEARKEKVSPFYHEKLDALLDAYARRLAQWQNDYNRNQAAYPSQFISGASGFDMRKHNKQMSREDTLWKEYEEINSLLDKIRSIGTGPVDLTDPHAREILTDQLQRQQAALDRCKAMNAYYRKHKAFAGFPGLSPDAAANLTADFAATRKRCPWVDKPFPDYELASIRGKLKRIQSRLEELDKLEAAKANPAPAADYDGFQLIHNAAENRLQIVFDEIPAPEIRAALKENGFRWSPRNKAWQRQLTDSAERAAKRILNIS